MTTNPFLTSLQDLVFGLFGGVAVLVIVLSTFSENDGSLTSDFVFVEVVWHHSKVEELAQLRPLAEEVLLVPVINGGPQVKWMHFTSGDEIVEEAKRGYAPRSLYYAGPVHEMTWVLQYPETAIEELRVRTKRGITHYRSGVPIRIETVTN